jgi:hypothetical protein
MIDLEMIDAEIIDAETNGAEMIDQDATPEALAQALISGLNLISTTALRMR